MFLWHKFAAYFVVVALFFGAIGTGHASIAHNGFWLTICAGEHVSAVKIGFSGDEIDVDHTCPECVQNFVSNLVNNAQNLSQQGVKFTLTRPRPSAVTEDPLRVSYFSRAPPDPLQI